MSFPNLTGSKPKREPIPDPFAEIDLKSTTGKANPFSGTTHINPFAPSTSSTTTSTVKTNPFESQENSGAPMAPTLPPKPSRIPSKLPEDIFSIPIKAKSVRSVDTSPVPTSIAPTQPQPMISSSSSTTTTATAAPSSSSTEFNPFDDNSKSSTIPSVTTAVPESVPIVSVKNVEPTSLSSIPAVITVNAPTAASNPFESTDDTEQPIDEIIPVIASPVVLPHQSMIPSTVDVAAVTAPITATFTTSTVQPNIVMDTNPTFISSSNIEYPIDESFSTSIPMSHVMEENNNNINNNNSSNPIFTTTIPPGVLTSVGSDVQLPEIYEQEEEFESPVNYQPPGAIPAVPPHFESQETYFPPDQIIDYSIITDPMAEDDFAPPSLPPPPLDDEVYPDMMPQEPMVSNQIQDLTDIDDFEQSFARHAPPPTIPVPVVTVPVPVVTPPISYESVYQPQVSTFVAPAAQGFDSFQATPSVTFTPQPFQPPVQSIPSFQPTVTSAFESTTSGFDAFTPTIPATQSQPRQSKPLPRIPVTTSTTVPPPPIVPVQSSEFSSFSSSGFENFEPTVPGSFQSFEFTPSTSFAPTPATWQPSSFVPSQPPPVMDDYELPALPPPPLEEVEEEFIPPPVVVQPQQPPTVQVFSPADVGIPIPPPNHPTSFQQQSFVPNPFQQPTLSIPPPTYVTAPSKYDVLDEPFDETPTVVPVIPIDSKPISFIKPLNEVKPPVPVNKDLTFDAFDLAKVPHPGGKPKQPEPTTALPSSNISLNVLATQVNPTVSAINLGGREVPIMGQPQFVVPVVNKSATSVATVPIANTTNSFQPSTIPTVQQPVTVISGFDGFTVPSAISFTPTVAKPTSDGFDAFLPTTAVKSTPTTSFPAFEPTTVMSASQPVLKTSPVIAPQLQPQPAKTQVFSSSSGFENFNIPAASFNTIPFTPTVSANVPVTETKKSDPFNNFAPTSVTVPITASTFPASPAFSSVPISSTPVLVPTLASTSVPISVNNKSATVGISSTGTTSVSTSALASSSDLDIFTKSKPMNTSIPLSSTIPLTHQPFDPMQSQRPVMKSQPILDTTPVKMTTTAMLASSNATVAKPTNIQSYNVDLFNSTPLSTVKSNPTSQTDFDIFSSSQPIKSVTSGTFDSFTPSAPSAVPQPSQFDDFEDLPIASPVKTTSEVQSRSNNSNNHYHPQPVVGNIVRASNTTNATTVAAIGITSRPSHVPSPSPAKPAVSNQPFAPSSSVPVKSTASNQSVPVSKPNSSSVATASNQMKSKPVSAPAPVPTPAPQKEVNLLDLDDDDDDPFGLSKPATTQSNPQNPSEEDVMTKFRKMYNLPEHSNYPEPEDIEDDLDFDTLTDMDLSTSNRPKGMTAKASSGIDTSLPSDGLIHARLSTTSLFTKEWTRYYWCLDHGALYIYNDDFHGRPGEFSMKLAKKIIPIAHNLRLLKIKPKEYKGFGIMYNFMMEEIFDYGPANVAKFASPDKKVVEAFWTKLNGAIKVARQEAARVQAFQAANKR